MNLSIHVIHTDDPRTFIHVQMVEDISYYQKCYEIDLLSGTTGSLTLEDYCLLQEVDEIKQILEDKKAERPF